MAMVKSLVVCFVVSFAVNCRFFDPNSNCWNPEAACFKPQTVAPYVVTYVPIPNKGSYTVSKLTGIQITFSQRLKDWLNPDNYELKSLGEMKIASVEQTGTYTVTLNLSGKLTNGNVDLSFPNMTNFTGLPFAKGTSLRLIGNLDIGVNIQDQQPSYFVSAAGGNATTTAVIKWSHDYRIDPNNNNSYVLKIGGATCADASPVTGGTNITGSGLTANTTVTSSIPISGNFPGAGTYFVRICVQNNSGFNKSGEATAIVINDSSAPSIQANISNGAYGAQQSINFTCSDNCKAIAFNSVSGLSPVSNPAAPVFNSDGTLASGTPLTGAWITPYQGDSTYSAITIVAMDKAGNQSAPYSFSYQINSAIPVISLNSPPATKAYVSANATDPTATITWQANQSGDYLICIGGSGCTAGPGCGSGAAIGSVEPYIQGTAVNTQVSATGSPALSPGMNAVHICLSNGTHTADSSIHIQRSDTQPSVAAVTPGDLKNAIPSFAPVAVTLSDPITLDLSTITTNTTDRSCSGTFQVSSAADDFAPNTCVQMAAQPLAVAAQTFVLNAAGGFEPGIYKVRVTTGMKDIAGNSLVTTYTLNTGFAVSGLLRQFTFNNDSTNLEERTFTGFHLSAMGNPKKVNGADGEPMGAYKFDGSGNDFLKGLDSGLPLGQAPRTVCAWVNPGSQCGTNCAALMYGTSGGAYLGNRANTAAFGFASGADYLGNTPLKLNTWTHLCHVYDGNATRIYLNGIQDGSSTTVAASALGDGLFIGKAAPSAIQSPFYGRLDDVRVYAGALTESSIRQIAIQVPTGLLAYYSFSDATSQTAIDYSNNGRNGIVTGAPAAIADRFGNPGAYNFSSPSQSISASDEGFPTGNSARTVCSWIFPTAGPGAGASSVIVRYGSLNPGEVQLIGIQNDGATNQYFYGNAGDNLTATLSVNLNVWTHICGAYDSEKAMLFINGLKVATASKQWNTKLSGASGLFIGQAENSGTQAFSGRIDDVRIYGRVLEQHEITVLSSQLATDLVRQYSFNNGQLTDDNGGPALNAVGNPSLSSGADNRPNGAFIFNGNSQYLFGADTGLPFGNSARTMCVRVKPVNVGLNAFALSYGTTNPGENSFLYAGGLTGITFGTLSNNLTSTEYLPANIWSHFCSVLGPDGKATIYLNGKIPAGGAPTSMSFNTITNGALAIGARSDAVFRWAGSLDDVRIYSRALNPTEILELQGY
ncbi:MAG: Ig-like domain-containing protein [Turneriella sp.]|nr:Ig-like domain-containing protein [Turneriella sp.]